MTEQKHLKALVRARMARTGESYTTARRQIVKDEVPPGLAAAAVFRAHDKHCTTVVFTPDGANLVTGGFGGQARIWTLDGELVGELVGHESSVNVVRISADGSTLLTAASDRTVRLWDFVDREERALLGTHRKQVLALDLDTPRASAWSGGHDGRLQRWDLHAGEAADAFDLGGTVTSVAVRPDDGTVAAATVGAGISIRAADGSELSHLAGDAEVVNTVTWSGEGSSLLASMPGRVVAFASDSWEAVRTLPSGDGGVLPVALSPSGGRLALGWDHHVALWSADESHPAAIVDGLPKGVYGLSFSPDGTRLALAAADGRVRTWTVT